MPSLIDLRRRIRSVKNTQQITKAMKMVSAAKLRRAQDQVLEARPYAQTLREILSSVLGRAGEAGVAIEHPLLAQREEKKVLLVFLTGDKGLCGAFNGQLLRESRAFLAAKKDVDVKMAPVGKKGRDFYARRQMPFIGEWINFSNHVELETAREIAGEVMTRFESEEIDAAYLIYGEFRSALSQKPVLRRILPVEAPAAAEDSAGPATDYIYEQPPEELFRTLLPRYVEVQIYQAMLESAASEHAARMAAMDSATRNAGEVLESLTLKLNRTRQAAITTEIIEVVSGAAAQE